MKGKAFRIGHLGALTDVMVALGDRGDRDGDGRSRLPDPPRQRRGRRAGALPDDARTPRSNRRPDRRLEDFAPTAGDHAPSAKIPYRGQGDHVTTDDTGDTTTMAATSSDTGCDHARRRPRPARRRGRPRAGAAAPANVPSFDDVRAAHRRIEPHIHRTPVLTSTYMNELVGAELFFKCENFQKAGAFKVRGACNAVFGLDESKTAKGRRPRTPPATTRCRSPTRPDAAASPSPS